MKTEDIVNFIINLTKNHPYVGDLSKRANLDSSIDLAKLFKDFADKGLTDEAMNIGSSQWELVISKLENKIKKLN